MIRVLIVDDSAFMRKAISAMLEKDPEIKVLSTARDGQEALEKIEKLKPDLVTMDVQMPGMDGLTALRHIMREMPLPVLMLSSLTTEGAHSTLEALELGAVDFIPKQLQRAALDIMKMEEELISKVKAVTAKKFVPRKPLRSAPIVQSLGPANRTRTIDAVAIGVSTGGPPALQTILSTLPQDFPCPIIIVQHMPPVFVGPFAERLNSISKLTVREASDGDDLTSGIVLIAPGGIHTRVVSKVGKTRIELSDFPANMLYKPSVDVMMQSMAEVYEEHTLGVILTGMGYDGIKGMRSIKDKGGKTIAEHEETCVVYGMPRAVIDAGIADKVVCLHDIPAEIVRSL
jgi:two-component system chemotaxis response regulator CheB